MSCQEHHERAKKTDRDALDLVQTHFWYRGRPWMIFPRSLSQQSFLGGSHILGLAQPKFLISLGIDFAWLSHEASFWRLAYDCQHGPGLAVRPA